MHAVVVRVTIEDFDTAVRTLQEQVLPRVRQAPGVVAGYWLEPEGNQGMSIVVFEAEDAARTAADRIELPSEGGVRLESVEVREVVASI
jgi:hypothetical protein